MSSFRIEPSRRCDQNQPYPNAECFDRHPVEDCAARWADSQSDQEDTRNRLRPHMTTVKTEGKGAAGIELCHARKNGSSFDDNINSNADQKGRDVGDLIDDGELAR